MAVTEDEARALALGLPATTERPSHGTPAFFVAGKLFARVREEGVLMVRVADEGEKHALVASSPAEFFTVPHYDGYAAVLVRLPEVSAQVLAELLRDAWRLRATATLRRAHPEV